MAKLLGKYNWGMGSMQIVCKDRKTDMLGGVADLRKLGIAERY